MELENKNEADANTVEELNIGTVKKVNIQSPEYVIDFSTVLGLVFAVSLIIVAAVLGQTQAEFFNVPSLLIVVFGTFAVTSISYIGQELGDIAGMLQRVFIRKIQPSKPLAEQLVNLSVKARKEGVLSLTRVERELSKDPYLLKSMQMVSDGIEPQMIDTVLQTENETSQENLYFAAAAMRKSGEIAPAMGLIGTLVGLVQMLAQLDDPSKIGPAMALALLTTFYGAILGTVILTPLSTKLERAAEKDSLNKTMIHATALSIASQENPRHLESALNSLLPARDRIRYFS